MPVNTSSQNRQSLLNQLDSIGSSRGAYNEADIFTAAEQDVAAFIERVKANIDKEKLVLSGKISNISVKVTDSEIQVRGTEHLLYQDRGVQGSKSGALAPKSPHKYTTLPPPVEVFVDYIKRKNLNLTNQAQFFEGESHFKELTQDEMILKVAYAMQRDVFENGFKPRNIFAKEIPKLKKDLKKSLKGYIKDTVREVYKFKR